MAWNDCQYITQSLEQDVRVSGYQNAFELCISASVDMSSSIYITEETEKKLYINSGSQSGSLIYTSEPHELPDEEVGGWSTGSFCPICKGYYVEKDETNMVFWSMDDLNEDGYPGVDVGPDHPSASLYREDISNEEMYNLGSRRICLSGSNLGWSLKTHID